MSQVAGDLSFPVMKPPVAEGPVQRFLNRELTWLQFNRRVLHEALDPRTPLLERVGFMAIFTANLDEFYQKRVGGIKQQIRARVLTRTIDGMTPQEQLTAIRQAMLPMLEVQAACFRDEILPELSRHGIHLLKWHELSDPMREQADRYFTENLFPVLTPLAVDPGHPFPFISNLSTSLGVLMRHPLRQDEPIPENLEATSRSLEDLGLQFARIKVPHVLPQWVQLRDPGDDNAFCFVSMIDVIRHNLDDLFPGMEIVRVQPFRVTRNAAIEREEEDAEDLLDMIEQELRDRRFANVIRLEVDDQAFEPMNQFLIDELNLAPEDVFYMPGELDYTDLWTIHGVNLPAIKYKPWTPRIPPRLADVDADIFSIIRAGDVLVHHPYESFSASVERFIHAATIDPRVVTIKVTLYRTTEDSPFIPALIRAAERGKQVVCLVELKARFDEERNVQLAQRLEKAGIHVVYGVVGLKTHTKTALVVRQEIDGMRCYAHIGTGNYHSRTANLYTDFGLFTCDPRLTGELVQLFHFLTGRSLKRDYEHLLVAPINMRRRFVEMIQREIAHCQAWQERGGDPQDPLRPQIVAKMNSLEDMEICEQLYEASQAGVRVRLNVRGFCCLRPQVEGLSENIEVFSIIGRFLEHSRIYCFHNQGQPQYFIGSADWMYRNLNNRVECITPIYDLNHQRRLQKLLDIQFEDSRQVWDMQPDGNYIQRVVVDPQSPQAQGTQQALMELTRGESRHH